MSALIAFAVSAGGCSARSLVVVDPCTDGGAGCVPAGLLDGLVGWWRLDDGPGSTTAHDSSAHGNDGTLHQLDPSSVWVPGRSGDAVAVYRNGWVQVADSTSIDEISDKITISAWIYFDGTITAADSWGTALSRQIGTGIEQHYHLSIFMDGRPSLILETPAGGTDILMAPNPVAKTTWTHLAGVYDGSEARIYVDGILVASMPMAGPFANEMNPVIIGGNGNDASGVPTELFPGKLDEIMLYARALSDAEIGALHAGALFPASAGDAGVGD